MRVTTLYEDGVERWPGIEPFIKWKHVDGAVLVCRNGTMVWLTLWEQFLHGIGLTNARKLEKKLENCRRT